MSDERVPRRSIMAVIALVLAVMPGCPLTGIVGGLLGLVALKRIDRNQPRMRGRRLAIAAMLIGPCSALVWLAGWNHLGSFADEGIQRAMIDRVHEAISTDGGKHPFADDVQQSLSLAELERVRSLIHDRFGDLRDVSISNKIVSGFPPSRVEAALLLTFADGSTLASAIYDMRAARAGVIPEVLLRELVIEDHERGQLRLGSAAED